MFVQSRLALSLLLALFLGAAAVAGETKGVKSDDGGVPFAKLANSFREAHGVESADRAALEWVLSKDYVVLQIGLFDLRYPGSFLADPKKATDLTDSVAALLDLQDHWLDWLGADAKSGERSDVRALEKWVRTWKPASLGGAL